jgi:hypothetical protein
MADSVLLEPIFVNYILPFLLMFTLVFAILEKSKILGEGKKQINAIISLVIGLLLIAFPFARDTVVKLMPFLAVVLVVLFVFMLLWGFISEKKEGEVLNKGLRITLGIIVSLAIIVAVLWVTGAWDVIYDTTVKGSSAGKIWINVLLVAIIGGAIAVVLSTTKNE